jgi:2-polyprenyl-3-methyl-5-hydroxy-6-metoxy-1,4-benzoquinol methylase
MTTNQQSQALEYFSKQAADWRRKAEQSGERKVNVIGLRNSYVLQVANERSLSLPFLDVGCGTGELVIEMSVRDVTCTGVDYSREMIDLAMSKARAESAARARFVCSSIFDFDMQPAAYDLISANGFIEYISLDQMLLFFDRVGAALAPGGSFVVGSRNRLFNLMSMNDFTLQEVKAGATPELLQEAVDWTNANGMLNVASGPCAPFQPRETEHPITGVKVKTRFQYSPLQLMNLLQERGLTTVEVYPVHIHGVTPQFKTEHAEVHASIANLLQDYARRNTRLLAHASTFMLHAIKQ